MINNIIFSTLMFSKYNKQIGLYIYIYYAILLLENLNEVSV